jgi:hypothetical protein
MEEELIAFLSNSSLPLPASEILNHLSSSSFPDLTPEKLEETLLDFERNNGKKLKGKQWEIKLGRSDDVVEEMVVEGWEYQIVEEEEMAEETTKGKDDEEEA